MVGEADNGAQAVRMFKELEPDLVTLDVMMPAVEGVDSLKAFRAIREENPNASILIVSAIPFEKTRDTFMEEGALGYVIKPFTRVLLRSGADAAVAGISRTDPAVKRRRALARAKVNRSRRRNK